MIFGLIMLASETTQRAFLHNAARMLTDAGTLLIETFVPRPGQRLPDGPHPGVFPEGRSVVALKGTVDTVVVFAAENHDDEHEFPYSEIVLPCATESRCACCPARCANGVPNRSNHRRRRPAHRAVSTQPEPDTTTPRHTVRHPHAQQRDNALQGCTRAMSLAAAPTAVTRHRG
jgi:hypothetical protein